MIEIRHLSGPEPAEARTGLVLLHGRGSHAYDMAPLAEAIVAADTCVLAPDAPGGTWYPNRFLVDPEINQPWLGQALDAVAEAVERLAATVGYDRIVVAGFSQGACLALEFAGRRPARYGGVAAYAGALIGPSPLAGGYAGDLTGTPVLLAVGDQDQHVKPEYVRASAEVFTGLGARVDLRIRPGMGHTIHPLDLEPVRTLISHL